ncbi:protein sel-1 homolog 3 [Pygocentrus nattereri]|uniref:protein sel-1 homolog 3 n=1 Tax=Pygocentrus nattereri TaxID=42514 RepID=UPI001890F080|nr:protein sel-1 homolog 3 [Pygocentrus nattereri]
MTAWRSSSFVSGVALCAAVLSLIHCDVSKHTTNSPSPALERSQHGDFVQFDSAPDTAVVESSVQVNYKCTKACRVGVEVVLSTPRTIGFVSFRRTWTHVTKVGETRTRTIELAFPPALVYKRDFFMRGPMDAHNVMVRAWLVHLDEDGDGSSKVGIGQYHQSLVRTFKFLQVVPLSERPAQPRTRSVAWGAELMWNVTKDRIEQCSPESDVVDLLVFPFASTGEKYGVIRTFSTFINRELETARLRAKEQPRLALSVWLYLLDWCNQKFCAILRHVNEHRKYGAPLIMLKDSGEVVVQMCLVSGEEKAFTAHSLLPLRTWIRLDLFINDSKAKLKITYEKPTGDVMEAQHTYEYQNSVLHNDTSGYFVIGGDIYMPGILGYFGPIRYHRLGAEQVVNPLSPARTLKLLDEAHTECEEMRWVTSGFLYALQDGRVRHNNDVCESYYEGLRRTFAQPRCTQTWSWDQQVKYGAALKILRTQEEELNSGLWSSRRILLLSQQLFQDVVRGLSEVGGVGVGPEVVSSLLELLQVCSCWGHHQASLMLATLHLAGLGLPVDQEKGHVYSLMGGLRDERLSLLHLGYKHMQGLDGFPKDQDVAYGYYANVGRQTSIDRDKIQDSEQSITEHVRVTNAEELQMQAGEEGDVVQFLRLQAERGHIESQKTLARMLFWGSNGVTKNISEAVKWHARSALEMTDATAMYDYGILLLKGTGVKKNRTLGLKLLQTAADMGAVTALNGLGWYYSTTGKDDRKAVYYFDLAAQNGSKDGVFNLGVYHLNGANPDTPGKNETAAFQCFLKAGQLGHVEGAVEAASSLSRGLLAGVRRDPEKAVILLKEVSERNGHLGYTVREALKAYQRGSWDEALLKYAMLAETGLVVAQNNAAHLCEVLKHGTSCQWRYHNYSTYNYAPHESGLLKMGDHYSAVGDMVKAIALYSRAALQGSPQGIYNLAVFTEEGYSIPWNVLAQMQIPAEAQLNKRAVVEILLLRCREFEGEKDDMSPCALALFGVQVRKAWWDFTHSTMQLTLAWWTLAVLLLFVLGIGIQSALSYCSAAHMGRLSNGSSERQRESDAANQVNWERVLDAAAHQRGRQVPSVLTHLEQNGRSSMIQNGRPLREAADLVIMVTGVYVCALCTMFISHLF